MSVTVNIHQAKTQLSRLLVRVAEGEDVIIAKNGQPLARLSSLHSPRPRTPGRFAGQIHGVESLLDPTPASELAPWIETPLSDPLHSSSPSS
jgi:prevent-host-death family protein